MNKDAVYVVKQPMHSIVSIVVVDEAKTPLHPSAHANLDQLVDMTDVIFVFSDRFSVSGFMPDKFTNLYRGCAYIHGSGNVLGRPIFQAMLYAQEIFRRHAAYVVTDLERLGKIRFQNKELLQTLTASAIVKPILRIKRLSPEELYSIYLPEKLEEEEKTPWWKFWKTEPATTQEEDRINSRYCSDSNLMFFKQTLVKIFLKNYEDKKFMKYINTFSEDDPSYLFASYIRELGIDNIDSSPEELTNIGEL